MFVSWAYELNGFKISAKLCLMFMFMFMFMFSEMNETGS